MKRLVRMMYLDYVNNFITIERFADYYSLSLDKAYRVIRIGRELQRRMVWKCNQI